MSLEESRLQPYGTCDGHKTYKAKRAARQAVRWHVAAFLAGELPCWKCARGMTFHVFRCVLGRQDHYHTGHMWRNASR